MGSVQGSSLEMEQGSERAAQLRESFLKTIYSNAKRLYGKSYLIRDRNFADYGIKIEGEEIRNKLKSTMDVEICDTEMLSTVYRKVEMKHIYSQDEHIEA